MIPNSMELIVVYQRIILYSYNLLFPLSTLLKSNSYIEILEKLLFCRALLDCYSSYNETILYKLFKKEYLEAIETQL